MPAPPASIGSGSSAVIVHSAGSGSPTFQTLPRIGPAMAQRIIENRPYHSFDDVSKVPGLGDDTLYAIMDRLSVDEPEEEEEEIVDEAEAVEETEDSEAENQDEAISEEATSTEDKGETDADAEEGDDPDGDKQDKFEP